MAHGGRTGGPWCILCLTAAAPLLGAEIKPLNLLQDGGFEQGEAGLSRKGWYVNNAGRASIVAEARSGRGALRFESVPHEWGFCAISHGVVPVSPKAIYHLSLWARGTGRISLAVYQYSAAGFIGTEFLPGELPLTDQWQEFSRVYRPQDGRVREAAFAIHLHGHPAAALIDDAAFAFNPEENPGVTIEPNRPATRTLHFQVKTSAARVTLWVNGQAVPVRDGGAVASIAEGLVAVGVSAEAAGPAPGVSVQVQGHPETAGRWRLATREEKGWTEAAFDDARWPLATPRAGGLLWADAPGAATVFLRQVLLWNATHYGPNRCLIPPLKEWEFPRGGFDTLHLALYSPLPCRLDDYEFILDVPDAFRLLDLENYWPRYITHTRPTKVVMETLTRDGQTCRRYRLSYPPSVVLPDRTGYTLLPLVLEGEMKSPACRFYFRRAGRGNFTELEQSLPVRILPPVNGRQPKHVMISQYSPVGYCPVSREHLEARLRHDAAAGCNVYMIGWNYGWGDLWRQYLKLFHDTAAAQGARLILWMNFPLNYGGIEKGHLAIYPDWIRQNPQAHGRYYGGKPAWGETDSQCPFCNQYAISPEGADFWAVVRQEYARALAFLPRSQFVFSDWEFHNINKDGTGVHCFCDRCKKAFREFARLSADADLADEAILRTHRDQWLAFRDWQDGELQGRIAAVVRELGRRYMTYSWASNMTFWAACRGKLDGAFVGMPGNSVADSYFQKMLDDYAAEFRARTGLKRALGQRFVFFKDLAQDGWKAMVLSHDGFVHPRSWKAQVLRVVAALAGGIDLQNSDEFCGGIRYYLGEATRLISTYEPLFWDGTRADDLASSDDIAYPNLLVLRLGDERLVLLFNEEAQPRPIVLHNKDLQPGLVATVFGQEGRLDSPERLSLTVPADDVLAVHIGPKP